MDNKQVLAVVGNREISEADLQLLIRSLDPQRAAQFQSEEGKKRLLEELVNQELFYLDAIDSQLDKDEAYLKELHKVEENFLKQYAISRLVKTAAIDEDEAKNYFEENKEQFKSPATAKASHVLVDTEEEAEKVLVEVQEGLSFEEAANKYSKCPSKAQGGSLGNFSRGQMVPEFEEAVFSMEKDEISKPVKTQFGYHLIKVFDHTPEEMKSFDEVKGQLAQQLLSQKQQNLYLNKVQELKDKYEIKVNL
ncbi:peptidyl-prolyl cis-trans isomerase C [Natronincola peptidivorans]|uniref:Peptidyl-prolyl cis-trans isomerase C n=1 Tax=Natronincola peptidivorans TaxID=426128 RepID=A0A1I0ARU5_9FIRM|nr:peptidylprolyl isomerase [Natronincola peptidivorans]SES96246.1 peptidyl-prolyl cis-trans isomerase C [Natronincola peptidivorans]